MTQAGQPKYQQIAADLRARIEAGEFTPGDQLPTHAALMERYGVALNTVRDALGELRERGLVETFQGTGTFVLPPGERGEQDTEALLSQLRSEIHDLTERVESLEAADVKAALACVESNLRDLFGKLGFDYPREDETEDEASEAVAHGKRA